MALAIGGCDARRDVVAAESLTAAQQSVVFGAVRRALRDPESARFGPLNAAALAGGDVAVCGSVNARNGFGGYTGPMPFAGRFLRGEFALIDIASDRQSAIAMLGVCQAAGVPVLATD
ncbi:hypothetical protein [Blastochloris tepida]|uniref:hypothetical protein n=1 Tax=Blastochloris tepida TaxID=2233851 RepID=UPI000F84C4CE|nr:hypothetical protein [Blastochloris tepida]